MSAQFQQNEQPLNWLDAPRDRAHPPEAALSAWLTYSGLLTMRMKKICASGFRLERLRDDTGPGLMVDEPWLRRVVLWCGGAPCVYAESHLPRQALESLPGLRALGNDPLGETLQAEGGVSRSDFEYALLYEPTLPGSLRAEGAGPIWARRSFFDVGGSPLIVAEAFLPGILALQAPG